MISVDHIARYLKANSLRLFSYPGGTIAALYDACHRYGVEVIISRSEAGAAFMAIGASKSTGMSLQVCAVTSGPGFTNALTGLADAYYDSVPLLLLAGQIGTPALNFPGNQRQKGFQHTRAVEMARPVCKSAYQATNGKDLVAVFMASTLIAMAGRKGSCFLDMPSDCQKAEIDG